ncbi:hypothetical protein [Nostoc sp.]
MIGFATAFGARYLVTTDSDSRLRKALRYRYHREQSSSAVWNLLDGKSE